MKKELLTSLYSRLKMHKLNVNVLPLLLNEKEDFIINLLNLSRVDFIEYINDLVKHNDISKNTFSVDEMKSDIAYKLSLCTERRINSTFYKRIIDKGVKGEQLINIANALKKLNNDYTLGIILQIVENKRIITSKKIVELIESLSVVENKNILNDILIFIKNSSKKSDEIIDLIIYILSIRNSNTKMLIDLANMNDYKNAKKIIEIISNSTYGYCANAAYELIKSKIIYIEMKKLIKFVEIISKAKGEKQAQYTRLLIMKCHSIDNILEVASLVANCNMPYQSRSSYTIFVENRDKKIDNLIEWIKLAAKSYSSDEADSLCEILTNDKLIKSGNAFKIAQEVSKLDSSNQMVYAARFVTNKIIIDRGIVFELVDIANKINDETKFKIIYEIILKDEVISISKIVELVDSLTTLSSDEIIFVRDNMIDKGMLENEEFIEMISYLSAEDNSKLKIDLNKIIYSEPKIDIKTKLELIKLISQIECEVMIESVIYSIIYINTLGYEKTIKYLKEISILDSQKNHIGACALQLNIIEDIEKNILKQKTFLEIYKSSPELAMDLLENSDIDNEEDITSTTRIRKNIGKK